MNIKKQEKATHNSPKESARAAKHWPRKGERWPELGRAGKRRRQQQHLEGKPSPLLLSAGTLLGSLQLFPLIREGNKEGILESKKKCYKLSLLCYKLGFYDGTNDAESISETRIELACHTFAKLGLLSFLLLRPFPLSPKLRRTLSEWQQTQTE